MNRIPEQAIVHPNIEMLDAPGAAIESDMHGKSLFFPTYKMVEELAPTSFTSKMLEDNFASHSGDRMVKMNVRKAFVKPNEVLAKIKPRLIQHFGPQGSAQSALMKKTIESSLFRLPFFLTRSIKCADTCGLNDRLHAFICKYRTGGYACTDFGSFDSSVTDKCTEDSSREGIRLIIEKAIMEWLKKKFRHSDDFKNTADHRWKDKCTVIFDAFRLVLEITINNSGDGLTSVGNLAINAFTTSTTHAIHDAIRKFPGSQCEHYYEEYIHVLHEMQDEIAEQARKWSRRLA